MDCKKYYNTFWARLAIVLFLAGICTWLITESNWLWLCIAVPTLAWSIVSFYRLYTYHTRKVAFLLDAIENNDPAVHFYEHVVDTGIFLIGCLIFFLDTVKAGAGAEGISVFSYLIIFFVGLNFVFELLSNILLSPTIVRLINIRKKN